MPNPDPELTPVAWEDMDYLFDAVLETSGSDRVAADTYDGVLRAVEDTAPMPYGTPSVMGSTGITCDYRWVEHKGWMAFYHVKDDNGILVDRVLWGKSDWVRALRLTRGR